MKWSILHLPRSHRLRATRVHEPNSASETDRAKARERGREGNLVIPIAVAGHHKWSPLSYGFCAIALFLALFSASAPLAVAQAPTLGTCAQWKEARQAWIDHRNNGDLAVMSQATWQAQLARLDEGILVFCREAPGDDPPPSASPVLPPKPPGPKVTAIPEVTIVSDGGRAYRAGVQDGLAAYPGQREQFTGYPDLLSDYEQGFEQGRAAPPDNVLVLPAPQSQPEATSLSDQDFKRGQEALAEEERIQQAREQAADVIKELGQERPEEEMPTELPPVD